MPREVVYGDGVPYGTPDEPGPARTIVEVSWSRNNNVQIPRAFGVFTGLDRAGINLLIKQLRRARDQAFGRDE
jgi:hypothetical protein